MDTTQNYNGWLESHPVLYSLDGVVKALHGFIHQATIPVDENLLTKLGISKSDKIFFYAGYHGDWASSLGRLGCEVTYSDLSAGLIEIMKYDPRNMYFSQMLAIDAALYPDKPFLYDWSVTFEPAPMVFHDKLDFALLRSLLNKKGGKLITRSKKDYLYEGKVIEFASNYGVELEVSCLQISSKTKFGIIEQPISHKVYTLMTNNKLREKAFSDLLRQ